MLCRWSKGSLEAVDAALLAPGTTALAALQPQLTPLEANTHRHLEGLPADHVLLAGPSGSGKSWLLWDATLAAGVCVCVCARLAAGVRVCACVRMLG